MRWRRDSWRAALDQILGLTLLHHLAALDRPLEPPLEALEHAVRRDRLAPGSQTLLNGETEEAMGDALAEDRALHELGVGVQHVVIAREPGEEDDVGLGDGAPRRGVVLADPEILKEDGGLGIHGAQG